MHIPYYCGYSLFFFNIYFKFRITLFLMKIPKLRESNRFSDKIDNITLKPIYQYRMI